MIKTLNDIKKEGVKVNTIYNADCLEVMRYIRDKSIDLVLTDPPYNEDYKYRNSNFKDKRDDYYSFLEKVFIEIKRILKNSGSFYLKHSSRQIDKILPLLNKHFIFRNLIVWISNSQAHPKMNYDSYYEPIYFYTKTDDYIFNKKAELREKPKDYWSGEGKEFIGLLVNCWYDIKKIQAGCLRKVEGGKIGNIKPHPCSMPERLAERIIKISSNESDTILDPFLGSGTTAVAAKQLNRRFIGIEISSEYCKIAEERLRQEVLPI